MPTPLHPRFPLGLPGPWPPGPHGLGPPWLGPPGLLPHGLHGGSE